MGNRMVTRPMTSRDHEMSNSWPQYAYSPIFQNSWRCYLATVASDSLASYFVTELGLGWPSFSPTLNPLIEQLGT